MGFPSSDVERMEYLKIISDGKKFQIVAFGSLVSIGPMALKALKADPGMKTRGLSLEDAQVNKDELEKLMAENMEHRTRKRKT